MTCEMFVRRAMSRAGLVFLMATLLTSGCHSVRRNTAGELMQVDPVAQFYGVELEDGQPRAGQAIRNSDDKVGTGCSAGAVPKGILTAPQWIARAGSEKACRNSAQSELLILSNEVCEQHLADAFATSAIVNVTGSVMSMLLAGASSIVSGRAGQNLSGAAAVVAGARTSVNAEVYQGMLIGAIVAEIQGLRSSRHAAIQKRRQEDVASYPSAEAIADALSYHDLCSFYVGVASLVKNAGRPERGADPAIQAQADAKAALLADVDEQLAAVSQRIKELGEVSEPTQAQRDELSSLTARRDGYLELRQQTLEQVATYRALLAPTPTPAPTGNDQHSPPAPPAPEAPNPPKPAETGVDGGGKQ